MEIDIARQQITKSVDIILGGGTDFFLPKSKGGKREDGRDLIKEAQEIHGYTYINTVSEFRRASKLPLFGLFSSKTKFDIKFNQRTIWILNVTEIL
jgi:alkaline phosphatase